MKKNTSNLLLCVSIFNILWFTIAAIYLQFQTTTELSSTLIVSWYTFWTSEIFLLAGIKVTKVIKHNDEEICDDASEIQE